MITKLAVRILPERVLSRLRLVWQWLTLWRYRSRIVRHTYGGVPLVVSLTDPLAEGWYDHDWPPLVEIERLRAHKLRPGATVFDLGAHQGIVALMLADAVGPAGSVIALEANSHNAAIARRNRDRNQAYQLQVVHGAVAEESGTLRFQRGLNGRAEDGRGGWGVVEVPAWSIDDLAARYGAPDVLFVDVEGFEARVLRGARETLLGRPDCFVEVHHTCGLEHFGDSVADVLALFPPEAYALWIASGERGSFVPHQPDLNFLNSRFFLLALTKE